ncbi:MAG: hypothetical protein ACJAZ8_000934 [Planctomycetota bacterium]|jgi:hypothetical protein
MSTDSKSERACPHCTGKSARPAQGYGLHATELSFSGSIEHQKSCPLRVRAKRLNSLATGFLGASLFALSVPGCYVPEPLQMQRGQTSTGLDNGTVGVSELPPGKDAA